MGISPRTANRYSVTKEHAATKPETVQNKTQNLQQSALQHTHRCNQHLNCKNAISKYF